MRKSKINDLFWSYVDIRGPEECWNWRGGLHARGYGHFNSFPRQHRANRIAWILTNGEIPEGKMCLHKCNNKKCVNPNHLYLGNYFDNARDKYADPTNVDKHGGSVPKLYDEEVWLIKKLLGNISQKIIAKMFSVHHHTIGRIKKDDNFKTKGSYKNWTIINYTK